MQIRLRDFDEIAEDLVIFDFQRGDAATLLFFPLQSGDPVLALLADDAQLVEFRVIARLDQIAVAQRDRRLIHNRPLNQLRDVLQFVAIRGLFRNQRRDDSAQ